MDPFKQYLQEHRSQLDTDAPREQVWSRIQVALPAQRPLRMRILLRYAAAACVAVLLGLLAWQWVLRAGQRRPDQREAVHLPLAPRQGVVPPPSSPLPATNSLASGSTATIPPPQRPGRDRQPAAAQSVLPHLEMGFMRVIRLQLGQVRSTPLYSEGPEYFTEFKSRLEQLDEEERKLKKQLSHTGIDAEQLDQLVRIYQDKIHVLKQLQNEIDKTNKYYRQAHPETKPSSTQFMNI